MKKNSFPKPKKRREIHQGKNPRKKKPSPDMTPLDEWEIHVAESLRSIAKSLAQSLEIQRESHVASSRAAEQGLRFAQAAEDRAAEQHRLTLENVAVQRARLEEIRALEKEAFERERSSAAREQAHVAQGREMVNAVKQALPARGHPGNPDHEDVS